MIILFPLCYVINVVRKMKTSNVFKDDELLKEFYRYLKYHRRLSDKTIEVYLNDALLLKEYLSGRNIPIENAALNEVEEFIKIRTVGLTNRTKSRIISSIKAFYRFLIFNKIVETDIAKMIEKPKKEISLPKTLSEREADLLIKAFYADGEDLSIRDWALFELIYSCGLRISEAVSLDLGSIDLESYQLTVIGKRNKERISFIGEIAKKALLYYLEKVREKLVKNNPKENALFVNRRGARLTRQAAHKRFHEITTKFGINATVHTLRHSFATHMLLSGADIRSVQEMLGHKDIKTTQLYTHLDTRDLIKEFDAFNPLEKKENYD